MRCISIKIYVGSHIACRPILASFACNCKFPTVADFTRYLPYIILVQASRTFTATFYFRFCLHCAAVRPNWALHTLRFPRRILVLAVGTSMARTCTSSISKHPKWTVCAGVWFIVCSCNGTVLSSATGKVAAGMGCRCSSYISVPPSSAVVACT